MLRTLQSSARIFRFIRNNYVGFVMLGYTLATVALLFIAVFRYEQSVYPFNKELSADQLNKNSNPIDIKATYYINKETIPSNAFASRFLESNGPQPLKLFLSDTTAEQPETSTTISHANCLKKISQEEIGWYLICEDNGAGNFGHIHDNTIVKEIAAQTEKKFINLSVQPYSLIEGTVTHSLSRVYLHATAYLVHSSYASELAESVLETSKSITITVKYDKELSEPRLFFTKGNGKGAFVGLISTVLS